MPHNGWHVTDHDEEDADAGRDLGQLDDVHGGSGANPPNQAEDFGVAGRGAFYDQTGAIREVVQNHLLQVVALLAMEPPAGYGHQDVRDEKAKVLRAMPALRPGDVIRGQYAGYTDEAGVAARSTVETCAHTWTPGAGPGSRFSSGPASGCR
jgi:glucose-6-phosphate dehydrogenase-like protein